MLNIPGVARVSFCVGRNSRRSALVLWSFHKVAMRKPITILLAGLLIVAVLALMAYHPADHEPLYHGRKLSAWVQSAVVEGDEHAELVLARTSISGDAIAKVRIEQELIHCVTKALRSKNSLFWKPYTFARTNSPFFIARKIPEWREARKMRAAAALWVSRRTTPPAEQLEPWR